ncbi:autotransporter-associated beta strand repeat-containing protein, partial [Rhodanobacter sp. Si-c]
MNKITANTTRVSGAQANAGARSPLERLHRRRLVLSLSLALGSLSFCGGALAGSGGVAPGTTPIGGVVVGGAGSIAQNGLNTVVNQQSTLLALNWQSFNLGKDASVLFKQPSFNAVALNRILDQNPSQIFGHINSNGQVFLINTHGIIFGSGAQLNVGGLVASTLDLTPTDFLSDHFNLDAHGGSAGVVNHGTIQAASGGSVSLIGGQVENDGLIVANYGHINLDGADKAVLDFDGDGLISVQVTGALQQRLNTDEAAVTNNGTLQADSGTVVLQASAAKDLFTNLVNNTGVIDAHGISTDGGVVRLVGTGGNTVDSGSIDASGVHGGSVQLLSDQDVDVGGSVDASGALGGGSIRVGGGEGLLQAANTTIEAGASLNADATQSGNGGSIAVWSNQTSNVAGNFSARGGALDGNGGSIETSGEHVHVADGTRVNTLAPRGQSGDWLIDPEDFTIALTGGDITGATLSANLSSGDVTILSSQGTKTPGGTGSINVDDAVSWGSHKLTLTAADNINIDAAMTVSGTAGLALNPATANGAGASAESAVTAGTTIIGSSGSLTLGGSGAMALGSLTDNGTFDISGLTAGTTVTSLAGGGTVSLGANTLTLSNASDSFAGVIGGTGGSLTLTSGTETLTGTNTYTGGTTISGGELVAGNAAALGTGAVSMAGGSTLGFAASGLSLGNAITLNGAATVDVASGQSDTLTGIISGANGSLSKTSAGTLTLSGANTYGGGTTINGGELVAGDDAALGTGAMSMAGGSTLGFAASSLSLGNAITFNGAATVDVASGQSDTLTGIIGGVSGSLTKTSAGTLTLSGANTYGGGTTINGGTLAIGSGGSLSSTGAVTLAGTGTFDISAAGDQTIGSLAGTAGSVDLGANTLTLGNASGSFAGVIAGTGGSLALTSGTETLTGANTYTGGTTINGGTLAVASDSALGAATAGVTINGGTLENTAAFSTGRAITLGTGGGTLQTDAALTVSGVISGTGLTKTGTSTLTLTGTNTYTGGTAINGGELVAGNDAALGTGALTMAGGSTLGFAASGLSLGNTVTLNGAATVDVASGQSDTLTGVISGASGSLTKTSAGTLTLSGADTYGGGTTINGGTLAIGSGGSLAATGAVTLANASGAVFDISAAGAQTIGSLSGGGATGGTVALGANTLTLGNASGSFAGVIGGAGGSLALTSGTETLTGANTYTGGTTISGGELVAGNDAALGTGALTMAGGSTLGFAASGLSLGNAITLNGAATVDVASGQSDTLTGVIGGASGSLTKTSAGTLTLSGANTYSGGTVMDAGILSVAADGNLGGASGGLTFDGGTLETTA